MALSAVGRLQIDQVPRGRRLLPKIMNMIAHLALLATIVALVSAVGFEQSTAIKGKVASFELFVFPSHHFASVFRCAKGAQVFILISDRIIIVTVADETSSRQSVTKYARAKHAAFKIKNSAASDQEEQTFCRKTI